MWVIVIAMFLVIVLHRNSNSAICHDWILINTSHDHFLMRDLSIYVRRMNVILQLFSSSSRELKLMQHLSTLYTDYIYPWQIRVSHCLVAYCSANSSSSQSMTFAAGFVVVADRASLFAGGSKAAQTEPCGALRIQIGGMLTSLRNATSERERGGEGEVEFLIRTLSWSLSRDILLSNQQLYCNTSWENEQDSTMQWQIKFSHFSYKDKCSPFHRCSLKRLCGFHSR